MHVHFYVGTPANSCSAKVFTLCSMVGSSDEYNSCVKGLFITSPAASLGSMSYSDTR